MTCDCIENFDKQLSPHGVRIDQASVRTFSADNPRGELTQRVRLSALWVGDRGRKKPELFATFCPLCGERYLPEHQ